MPEPTAPRLPRPLARPVRAASVLASAGILLVGCGLGTAAPTTSGTGASVTAERTAPTTPPPRSEAPAQGAEQQLPVYWLGGAAGDPVLYREFRAVQNVDQPIAAAVAAMTRSRPADPDYTTPWSPASKVTASMSSDGGLTVDISRDAFARKVDAATARAAIQQLVYTATAAASSFGFTQGPVPVTVLVDSRTGYRAWDTVTLGSAMTRDGDALAPVWILDPSEGQRVKAEQVTVRGQGVAFENTFQWAVSDAAGTTVETGYATSGATGAGARGDFSFAVELKPGTYSVRVFEQDVSDGESGRTRVAEDTKSFVVR